MVIHWSWFRKEMVLYERGHSTRHLGQSSGKDVDWNSQKVVVQFSVLRRQLKSKGHGKLSIHLAVVQEKTETIFRTVVSATQLSLYGAVAEMCEEYKSLHDRSGRPFVLKQSIVLSAIRTRVPWESDDPA